MKRTLIITAACLALSSMAFGIPRFVSYQGYLIRTDGSPLDTVVSMTFKFYSANTGGTQLWTETQPACAVTAGLFKVSLGSATAIPDSFNWAEVWLGVTVGDNSEMVPRTRFASVPYAYRAGTVDGATGGTISGTLNAGSGNTNTGIDAFVFGTDNHADHHYATVGGGTSNQVTGSYGFVGGGRGNLASLDATVVGGNQNTAFGSGSSIAGGYRNEARESYASICGGYSNFSNGWGAVIGGGRNNQARGDYSVIAGGGGDMISDSNSARGLWSCIGGGIGNDAAGNLSVVSGGDQCQALASWSVIGGGFTNAAGNLYSTVAGGGSNAANGESATIGGGWGNSASALYSTIAGGSSNSASNQYSSVGGGQNNWSTGFAAAAPGGSFCQAGGSYSFAAGRRAKADHEGSFVWADNHDNDYHSDGANSFNVRAFGGVKMYTWAGGGAHLPSSSSSWIAISDSTKKTDIRRVDTKIILEKVTHLPICEWRYKAQPDPSIHHISPMAQDFWNAFRLGEDSLGISTIDPDGIALAAIQELVKQNEALRKRVEQLESEVHRGASADQTSVIRER